MKYVIDHVFIAPDESMASLRRKVAEKLGVGVVGLRVTVLRKSWKRTKDGGVVEARIEAETNEFTHNTSCFSIDSEPVTLEKPKLKHRPVVIGFGLRGILSAFILAKMGLQPIALESGISLSLRESRSKEKQKAPLNGEGGLPCCSGLLFNPDTLSREVRALLEEEGITFDTVNAHQSLTPAQVRAMVRKLHMTILELGGEVQFEASYLDTKTFFGRLRGVYYQQGGVKKFVRTSEVIFANGQFDNDCYLGACVESSQRAFSQTVYGRPLPDPKAPAYYLQTCFKTKQGDQCLIMTGLPNPGLLDVGSQIESMAQLFEFSGKSKNAISFIAAKTDRETMRRIMKSSYITGSPYSIPCSTVSDFLSKKNPLRIGPTKPANISRVKLRDFHMMLGSKISTSIGNALYQLDKAFPYLLSDDALLTGLIGLRGSANVDNKELSAKGLHVASVLPENSLDFGSIATSAYSAVVALCAHANKAH